MTQPNEVGNIGILVLWRDANKKTWFKPHFTRIFRRICLIRQIDSEKIEFLSVLKLSMWSIYPELFLVSDTYKRHRSKKDDCQDLTFKVPTKYCVLDKFFEARITSESSISKSKFTQTKLNLLEEPSDGQSRTF